MCAPKAMALTTQAAQRHATSRLVRRGPAGEKPRDDADDTIHDADEQYRPHCGCLHLRTCISG